jgi:hypothetical protein
LDGNPIGGADQPIVDTNTSKYGLTLVADYGNMTAAIPPTIGDNNSPGWHYGFRQAKNTFVGAANDALIRLDNDFGIPLFKVDPSGNVLEQNTTVQGSFLSSYTGTLPTLTNGNAFIQASAAAGALYGGQGSTNDLDLVNASGVPAAAIPHGSNNLEIMSNLIFASLPSGTAATYACFTSGGTLISSSGPC